MKRAFRFIIPSAFAIAHLPLTNGRETAQQRQTDGPAPGASGATSQTTRLQRAPTRTVKDAYTGFSSVAVDVTRNEIILQDENNSQIAVYGRTDNTPPQAALTEPKRIIGGSSTNIAMNCAVYVDPDTGDIYSVNGDIE